MAERKSISGMSDDEAQEFHAYYMQGMVGFTAVAVIAHALVWAWRPWITWSRLAVNERNHYGQHANEPGSR